MDIKHKHIIHQLGVVFGLIDLIQYVPVYNFPVMTGWVFLSWTSTKQGVMCLAQGHNTVTPVRLKPGASRSWVKHSTTDPQCSYIRIGLIRLYPFCQFNTWLGNSHQFIKWNHTNIKAPISLDCDCFATAGDRHREWLAKQSRNSCQWFVISSHVSPSGAK